MATTELKDPPFHLTSHNSVRLPQLPSASSATSPPTSPPAGAHQQCNHQVSSDIQVHSTAKHHNHVTASTERGSRSFPAPVLGPLLPHPGKALSPEEAAAAADREVNGNYYPHSANSGVGVKQGSDLPSKDCSFAQDSSSNSSELVLKMPGHACRFGSDDSINGNSLRPAPSNADDCEVTANGDIRYECGDSQNVPKRYRENGLREIDFQAVEQQCGLPYVVTDGALRSLSSSSSLSSSLSCQKSESAQTGSHVTFQIGENGLPEDKENNSLNNHHTSSLTSISSSASTSSSLYLKRQRSGSATGSFDGSLERIVEDQVSVHPLPAPVLERSLSCSVVEPPHPRTSTRSSSHDNSDSASCSSVEGMILGGLTSHHNLPSNSEVIDNAAPSPVPDPAAGERVPAACDWTTVPSKDSSQNASAGSNKENETSSSTVDKLYPGETAGRPKSLDPRSLCLPLPFRFLSSKTSSSSPTGKGKSVLEAKSPSGSAPGGPRHVSKARPAPKQSWLLRLFESKMFDMSIAIQYLYNSKEPGVQTYIGKYRVFFFLIVIE